MQEITAARGPAGKTARDILLIIVFGIIFLVPFLDRVRLFDWDEVNFAECSREMLVTGNYMQVQVNFERFWEKPPLFFWLQTVSMRIWGINETGARFVNAVCGIFTMLVVYLIGLRVYDRRFGLLWALAFLGSFLPSIFFKSGIIDPVFNLFIFTGIWFIFTGTQPPGRHRLLPFALAGVMIGLAVLTKGPVAFLIVMLTMFFFWASGRFKGMPTIIQLVVLFAVTAFISLLFYGIETARHGTWFLQEFIKYQIRLFSTGDAGHGRPWWFHPVVTLFGCFPASFFAIRAFAVTAHNPGGQHEFKKWMITLFWVVMILFSIVKTKTVLYASLTWFPVTFLAAYHLRGVLPHDGPALGWQRRWTIALAVFGGIVGLVITFFPVLLYNKAAWLPSITDRFAHACLSRPVAWNGYEWCIGAAYLAAMAIALVFIGRGKVRQGIVTLFLASALVLQGFMYLVAPRIEQYTQAGPIEFYLSKRDENCYMKCLFKTYADLFYWEKKPGLRKESYDEKWLLGGDIDRPAYFVVRAPADTGFIMRNGLSVVKDDYGFVYLKRDPQN